MVADSEECFSETFESYGTANMEWGYKVTFIKVNGEFKM